MIGHKKRLRKYKTKVILSIFFYHNGIRLEVNKKRKTGNFHKYVEIKTTQSLTTTRSKKKSKRKLKNLVTMKVGT